MDPIIGDWCRRCINRMMIVCRKSGGNIRGGWGWGGDGRNTRRWELISDSDGG